MVFRDNRWVCPRDGAALEHVGVGERRFMRCAQCRGALVEMAVLGAMVAAMDGVMPPMLQAPARRPLPCPGCGKPLEPATAHKGRGTFEPPMEIDGCATHGVWFDANELGRLLEWAGLAGLDERR